ncbi:MAG: transcriptional repressor [Terrimonas sp.]|nr:transcriptional repressor [Terrimonas sp.]
MNIRVEDILRHNRLSITGSRKKILSLFLSHAGALAHGDIEKKAGEKFDRVTIYRTLQAFVEKGILHTIPTSDNNVRYALCNDECYEGHHHDDHVHFMCRLCGTTTCINDAYIPEVKLPRGYNALQVEVVVHGICKNCKK